jgi:hypothetical protein
MEVLAQQELIALDDCGIDRWRWQDKNKAARFLVVTGGSTVRKIRCRVKIITSANAHVDTTIKTQVNSRLATL